MDTVPLVFIEAVQHLLPVRFSLHDNTFRHPFEQLTGVYGRVGTQFSRNVLNLLICFLKPGEGLIIVVPEGVPRQTHMLHLSGMIDGEPVEESNVQGLDLPSRFVYTQIVDRLVSVPNRSEVTRIVPQRTFGSTWANMVDLLKYKRFFKTVRITSLTSCVDEEPEQDNATFERIAEYLPYFAEVSCSVEPESLTPSIAKFLLERTLMKPPVDLECLTHAGMIIERNILKEITLSYSLLSEEARFLDLFKAFVQSGDLKIIRFSNCEDDFQFSALLPALHRLWIGARHHNTLELQGSFLMGHWQLQNEEYSVIKSRSSVVASHDRNGDYVIIWEEGRRNDTTNILFQFLH